LFERLACGYPPGTEEGLDAEDAIAAIVEHVQPEHNAKRGAACDCASETGPGPFSETPSDVAPDVSSTPVAILYYVPAALYVTPQPPYTIRKGAVGRVVAGTWGDFCRWLARSVETDPALDPDLAKRAAGAWVGGTWASPVRTNARCQGFVSTTLLIVDVDGGDPQAMARALHKYAACIHSTAKYTPTCPRCRVVILCSRPITSAKDYPIVHKAVRDYLKSRGFIVDEGAHDVGRLNFLPMHAPGIKPVHVVTDGKPLDVDRLLAVAQQPEVRRSAPRPSGTRSPGYIAKALANEAERVLDARSGDRHNQNYRSAASLARLELGLDDEVILGALLPAAEHADPDEDPAELERTIRDGIRAGREGE
jgi:hypothetical protein